MANSPVLPAPSIVVATLLTVEAGQETPRRN